MLQLVPDRGVRLDAAWADVLAHLPAEWPRVPYSPAMAMASGLDPAAITQVSLPLASGRVALLTLLRNKRWIEIVSVLPHDASSEPLTGDERTEATIAWVEACVRRLRGVAAQPSAAPRVEAAATRLQDSLDLHSSDLAVLLRAPHRARVLHPVAGGATSEHGAPSPRTPETQAALEGLELPSPVEAAAAALSAVADQHCGRAPHPPPARIEAREDAGALLAHLSATQRRFDEAAALEMLEAAGPGPWFLARRHGAEAAVQVVAVRPALGLVLDLQGDGP
jgi:hypothetical protein